MKNYADKLNLIAKSIGKLAKEAQYEDELLGDEMDVKPEEVDQIFKNLYCNQRADGVSKDIALQRTRKLASIYRRLDKATCELKNSIKKK